MSDSHATDWVALSLAQKIGTTLFYHLVERFGSPQAVLDATPQELRRVNGLGPERIAALAEKDRLRKAAAEELSRLHKLGAQAIVFADDVYPELLRQTAQPPPVLYVYGRSELLNGYGVGIVGSRAATSYGRRISHRLGKELGSAGICVVSGVALGIDAEAHAGCLEGGGPTIGVLGCGIDVVYPGKNRRLFEQIRSRGLLVSEYPLGTRPEGFRFPARNRIIAGLCRGIIVVEASKKSGSLITVQYALEEGREVFAVPGQIDSDRSAGAHWLVQQGATLIVSAADVLEQLSGAPAGTKVAESGGGVSPEIDAEAADLLSLLEPYPQNRDELLRRSGLNLQRLQGALLTLELAGLVEILPGDEVRLVGELP